MEAQEDSVTGPQVHEDGCDNQNPYVDVLPDTHEVVSQSSIPFQITQSQKKRRKFIPFKYHSKIFKKSKKNKDRNGNEIFQGADPHKHGARHAIEDNRVSTTSSSYESCRPHKNNVSCHTYVDIEECFEHRNMDIERCNSISTVSTLPVVTSRQRYGVEEHAGRQVLYKEEQPSVNMTPKINYEMKIPDKSKGMKKYMVLFCIVLVSIVVSTVVAGYVGTNKVVKDIPTEVEKQFKTMEEWKILEEHSNLTAIKIFLDNGLSNFSKKFKALNEQHFENLTSELESNTDDLKNETKMLHELITQRVMNETASKEDIKKTLFTILHVSICVNDCNGRRNGDYQSCYTCEGYVTCSNNGLVNQNCSESYPDRPVYWDNFKKRCLFESRTCDQRYTFD